MSLIVSSDPPDSLMTAGLGSRRLVSVPEDTTLRIPEDDEVTRSEQQPQCPPSTRPVSLISEAEVRGHPRPVTKAEPVTASQQISLWLLRSSAQDLGDWSAVGSLRNMLGLQSKGRQRSKRRKGRPMRWRIPWWRPLIQERRPVSVTSDGLKEDLVIVSHRRSGDIVHVSPPELVGVLVAGVGIVTDHLRLNVRVRAAT